MSYIVYNNTNIQTEDFKLIICNLDNYSDTVTSGLSREVKKTEFSPYKDKTYHLSTQYTEPLVFTITFIKRYGEIFTDAEIRDMNKWLMTPTSPKKLQYYSEKDDEWNGNRYFMGVFTKSEYHRVNGKFGITYTFENDSPFSYEYKEVTNIIEPMSSLNFSGITVDNPLVKTNTMYIFQPITDSASINLYIGSEDVSTHIDLTYGYVYRFNSEYKRIEKLCIYPYIDFHPIKYSEVGWESVNDVLFYTQENYNSMIISNSYNTDIYFYYSVVNKILGGIPDEFNT